MLEATGRVQARSDTKPDGGGVNHPRIDLRYPQQRVEPDPFALSNATDATASKCAIFVDQWYEVGDRRDRDKVDHAVENCWIRLTRQHETLEQLICRPRTTERIKRVLPTQCRSDNRTVRQRV